MAQLILFNKPFGVLSQFTDEQNNSEKQRQTLADYINISNIYAAGRLDKDSEGLLLLTDDGKLQQRICEPKYKLTKHYWVQVEGNVNIDTINTLRHGVQLKDGLTKPAEVKLIDEPEHLWQRDPPIRIRKSIATQWLDIGIREGRNRQVRRMTAAVNHPVLRLIRHQIGSIELGTLELGRYTSISVCSLNLP